MRHVPEPRQDAGILTTNRSRRLVLVGLLVAALSCINRRDTSAEVSLGLAVE